MNLFEITASKKSPLAQIRAVMREVEPRLFRDGVNNIFAVTISVSDTHADGSAIVNFELPVKYVANPHASAWRPLSIVDMHPDPAIKKRLRDLIARRSSDSENARAAREAQWEKDREEQIKSAGKIRRDIMTKVWEGARKIPGCSRIAVGTGTYRYKYVPINSVDLDSYDWSKSVRFKFAFDKEVHNRHIVLSKEIPNAVEFIARKIELDPFMRQFHLSPRTHSILPKNPVKSLPPDLNKRVKQFIDTEISPHTLLKVTFDGAHFIFRR